MKDRKNAYRIAFRVNLVDDNIRQASQDPFARTLDFSNATNAGKKGIVLSIVSRIRSATERALAGLSFAIQPTIFSRSLQAASRMITFKE
jgi:hypothetical protein